MLLQRLYQLRLSLSHAHTYGHTGRCTATDANNNPWWLTAMPMISPTITKKNNVISLLISITEVCHRHLQQQPRLFLDLNPDDVIRVVTGTPLHVHHRSPVVSIATELQLLL